MLAACVVGSGLFYSMNGLLVKGRELSCWQERGESEQKEMQGSKSLTTAAMGGSTLSWPNGQNCTKSLPRIMPDTSQSREKNGPHFVTAHILCRGLATFLGFLHASHSWPDRQPVGLRRLSSPGPLACGLEFHKHSFPYCHIEPQRIYGKGEASASRFDQLHIEPGPDARLYKGLVLSLDTRAYTDYMMLSMYCITMLAKQSCLHALCRQQKGKAGCRNVAITGKCIHRSRRRPS